MMTSSKKSLEPDYYVGIFWKILCSTTAMEKVIAKA